VELLHCVLFDVRAIQVVLSEKSCTCFGSCYSIGRAGAIGFLRPNRDTGRAAMTNDPQTVRRTVQFKFTLPAANSAHLASLLKAAAPFYEAFGGRRSRLLQNVDDPARFIHEIEYDTHEVIEINRQRVASDPRVQAYLQTWRSLLPGSVEIDVYREAG
jgi:hypothetical protein